MWNWQNDMVNDGVHYSRIIASWSNACRHYGTPTYFGELFKEWLKEIGVPEEDIRNIQEMARNGKMELETSAKLFLHKL